MEKNAENFQLSCPSCRSPMREVNEFGVHQCPRLCSGAVWDPIWGWDPAYKEAAHEVAVERESHPVGRKQHLLQPWADYLGRSLRTTYELAKPKKIIGITYADGKVAVSQDGMALIATLGAGRHLSLLPRGTEYIHAGVYSGPVMSAVVPHHNYLDRKYPKVKVFVAANSSGVNWGYIAFNCSGNPIVPPPLRS